MKPVYAGESLPTSTTKTIFLAGPTPRDKQTPSWRPDALKLIEETGFDGHVFIPEPRDGNWRPDYDAQIKWETDALHQADAIIFWIPRNMSNMPALTTNDEFGAWKTLDPVRVFLGAPKAAPHTNYQFKFAAENDIPSFRDLNEVVKAAVSSLGDGAERNGGECQVPLHIWKTPSFQNWYEAQTAAGIELHGARIRWVFRVGPKFVFFWALQVDMFVPSENRHKTNEVVLWRPDVYLTVAWHRPKGKRADDTVFALIREYRSPGVSADGFVWENPGGSSFEDGKDPYTTAADELKQELGMEFDPSRVRVHCTRQVAATMTAYRSHVYSVELTADEVEALRKLEADGANFGVAAETERTYPRVRSLKQIRSEKFVDWSTLGILYTVIADTRKPPKKKAGKRCDRASVAK